MRNLILLFLVIVSREFSAFAVCVYVGWWNWFITPINTFQKCPTLFTLPSAIVFANSTRQQKTLHWSGCRYRCWFVCINFIVIKLVLRSLLSHRIALFPRRKRCIYLTFHSFSSDSIEKEKFYGSNKKEPRNGLSLVY